MSSGWLRESVHLGLGSGRIIVEKENGSLIEFDAPITGEVVLDVVRGSVLGSGMSDSMVELVCDALGADASGATARAYLGVRQGELGAALRRSAYVKAYVSKLNEERACVSGSLFDGRGRMAYLRFVEPMYHDKAREILGAEPRVSQLLSIPSKWWASPAMWEGVYFKLVSPTRLVVLFGDIDEDFEQEYVIPARVAVLVGLKGYKFSDDPRRDNGYVSPLVECGVCQENGLASQSPHLYCGHHFHRRCLAMWTLDNVSCPMCRAELMDPVTPVDLCPVKPMDEFSLCDNVVCVECATQSVAFAVPTGFDRFVCNGCVDAEGIVLSGFRVLSASPMISFRPAWSGEVRGYVSGGPVPCLSCECGALGEVEEGAFCWSCADKELVRELLGSAELVSVLSVGCVGFRYQETVFQWQYSAGVERLPKNLRSLVKDMLRELNKVCESEVGEARPLHLRGLKALDSIYTFFMAERPSSVAKVVNRYAWSCLASCSLVEWATAAEGVEVVFLPGVTPERYEATPFLGKSVFYEKNRCEQEYCTEGFAMLAIPPGVVGSVLYNKDAEAPLEEVIRVDAASEIGFVVFTGRLLLKSEKNIESKAELLSAVDFMRLQETFGLRGEVFAEVGGRNLCVVADNEDVPRNVPWKVEYALRSGRALSRDYWAWSGKARAWSVCKVYEGSYRVGRLKLMDYEAVIVPTRVGDFVLRGGCVDRAVSC